MIVVLCIITACAAALNAVAGGGTFFVFPALTMMGIAPIAANITCTIALWPASLVSVVAYRKHFTHSAKEMLWLVGVGLLGGWLGAMALLHTSNESFSALVPWLMLMATLMFAYGKNMAGWVARISAKTLHAGKWRYALATVMFAATAFYGGFFGAGIGILTLAVLYVLGMEDVHQMNALKTVLATAINAAAFATFLFSPLIHWELALPMIAAAMVGGYGGAALALRFPPHTIRRFVLCVAILTTGYFFVR